MKIRFRQSGGYAGLIRGCEVDIESLSPEALKALESLAEKSKIRGMEDYRNPRARDLRIYEIEVEIGKEIKRITFDEMSIPDDLKNLFELLKRKAKPQPLK